MFRVAVLVLLSLFGIANEAGAQAQQVLGRPFTRGGTTAYTGPGDIVSGATAFYGLRAYTAAIAAAGTQSVVDLRRASDNATCTAKIATNGSVDLTVGTPCNSNTQTVTAWIGASSATVSKWYDQSGNGNDASQATAANQPTLALNVIGSLPFVQFTSGSGTFVKETAAISVAQPWTISAVAEATTSSNGWIFGHDGGGGVAVGYGQSGANKASLFAGSNTNATANNSVFHGLIFVGNGASSQIIPDGASTTVSAGTNTVANNLDIGTNGFNTLSGYIGEVGLWSGAFSAGNIASMNSNQHAYWGF